MCAGRRLSATPVRPIPASGRGSDGAMLVWIGFAVLAAAVTWAVTRPLLVSSSSAASAPDSELAVYRDQLAEVEAHLRQKPDDGRGWDVLAPVYMRMGDFVRASDAYERAIRILGESPQRLAGFARATIMAENGVVNEPARRAYTKLLAA